MSRDTVQIITHLNAEIKANTNEVGHPWVGPFLLDGSGSGPEKLVPEWHYCFVVSGVGNVGYLSLNNLNILNIFTFVNTTIEISKTQTSRSRNQLCQNQGAGLRDGGGAIETNENFRSTIFFAS